MPVLYTSNKTRTAKFDSSLQSILTNGLFHQQKPNHKSEAFHGQAELDSHTDTTVAGRNCTVLNHIEISCDVAPFSDTYETMKDVDIVLAAIGFTSVTGRKYVLVFN